MGSLSGGYNESGEEFKSFNPDNWAVSPAVTLPDRTAIVSFWAASQSPDYTEHFRVYAGESPDPETMTCISGDEDLTTQIGRGDYSHIYADLSEFLGKTVYIAIRHFNSDGNESELLIDQFEVFGEEYPEVTFEACGGYTPVAKETVNKKFSLDFLPLPTREGYTFAGWFREKEYPRDDEHPVESAQVYASATYFETDQTVYAHWIKAPDKLIKSFYFEDKNPAESGWTFKANGEGDGFVQEISTNYTKDNDSPDSREIPEGQKIFASYSTIVDLNNPTTIDRKALDVDNWAISPEITLPESGASLSIFAKSNSYLDEEVQIFAGESSDTDKMTPVTEVITVKSWVNQFENYTHITADLKDFAGKTVHIAICHKNKPDADRSIEKIEQNSGLLIDMMEVYGAIKTYPLWIDGVQANEQNKDDILGNGLFTYDPESNVLYLKGDYEGRIDTNLIRSDINNLTVNITKDLTLRNTHSACVCFFRNATLTGDGKLTVISAYDGAILISGSLNEILYTEHKLTFDNVTIEAKGKITGIDGWGASGKNKLEVINSYIVAEHTGKPDRSSIGRFTDGIKLIDCEVVEPEDGEVGENDIINSDGSMPKRVVISKKKPDAKAYDLWIDGVRVTDLNKDDVINNGLFTYDSEKNVLYVKGSYTGTGYNVIHSMIKDLTIDVTKDSALVNESSTVATIALQNNTTLKGEGKLTVSSANAGILVAGHALNIPNVKLTIDNMFVESSGYMGGISGLVNDEALEIINSHVISTSNENGATALEWFYGGITLTDCEIVKPVDGKISDDKSRIENADGSDAFYVEIDKKVVPTTEPSSGNATDPTEKDTGGSGDKTTDPTENGTSGAGDKSTDPTENGTSGAGDKSTDPTENGTGGAGDKATDPTENNTSGAGDKNTEPTENGTSGAGDGKNTEPTENGTNGAGDINTEPTQNTTNKSTEPQIAPTTPPSGQVIDKIKPGDSIDSVDDFAKTIKSEEDPAGSTFGLLRLRQKTVKKTSLTITWEKLKNAKYYVVYGSACGTKKGEIPAYKRIKKVKKNTYTYKKAKKGAYYKFFVVAVNKKNKVVASSKTVHIVTNGGKNGNDKSVKINKSKITLKIKGKFKIVAKEIPKKASKKVRRHRPIAYESSNKKVARIKKGVIIAKKKGTATVYVYAQNGLYKTIKVKVK